MFIKGVLSFNSYIEGGQAASDETDVEYLEWMLMTKHGPSVAVIHIRKVSGPGADMHGTKDAGMPGFQREPQAFESQPDRTLHFECTSLYT